MKTIRILPFLLLLFAFSSLLAQDRMIKRTHWIDMGQDESGVQMFLSFNFFEQDLYIETPDTVKKIGSKKFSTRCRYKLSNMTDKTIFVKNINIRATKKGVVSDVYNVKKNIEIKPWENYFGAFMTPKLQQSQKTANKVYMKIDAVRK